MSKSFTVYIERDIESGMYVGIVPNIPGAHTFAATLDELQLRLKEVISLCVGEMDREEVLSLPIFAGLTQVEVAL